MRRAEIDAPGFYEVALERSGRGGRRIRLREVVKLLSVEQDMFYTDSKQYRVRYERMLMNGPTACTTSTRDVLRRITDPLEIAKCEAAYEMVKLGVAEPYDEAAHMAASRAWGVATRAWNDKRTRKPS